MKRFNFTGIMAPTYTAFNTDESVNLDLIPAYASHLSKNGITAVWVNGTVGEGMSMTISERKQTAEAWMKCRDDITTVIIHCGAGCFKDTCELVKHAVSIGAEGIALLPILYDLPATPDDLVDYMQEVAKFCPKTPLFYYHIPMKTNCNISMSEFLAKGMKRIPNLAGIKFTDLDVSGEGKKCIEVGHGALTIFNGFDQNLLEGMKLGFDSAVCGSFSGLPQHVTRIFSLMKDSKESEAKIVQEELVQQVNAMFKQTGGGFTVPAMKTSTSLLMGIDLGPARLPVKAFTPSQVETLRNDLKNAGLTIY